jgi:septum formation protein
MLPVLASASPRRAELLRAAGLEFETFAVDIDEAIRSGESPQAYVRRLAMEKSARAQELLVGPAEAGDYRKSRSDWNSVDDRNSRSDVVVIGADTAVVIDGEILGKPGDDRDAARMLGRLSGRRHEVMTGVSLRRGSVQLDRVEVTSVYVNVLSNQDIEWYVQSGEGRDKAGSYAIQGLASRFIPRIEGSYANVVGLPVEAVFEMLRAVG